MLKRKMASVAIAGMMLVPPGMEAVANAAPTDTSVSIQGELKDEYIQAFESNGIHDKSTQEKLLSKLEAGQVLDADNPDAKPTDSDTKQIGSNVVTRNIYADGSVSTTSMEKERTRRARAAYEVQPCRQYAHRSWTRHDGCRVVYNGISFSYSFYADYSTRRVGKVNAVIRRVYRPTVHRAIGHSTSDMRLNIERKEQRGSDPAVARMSFAVTAVRILWTTTMSLTLNVANGSAWAGR